MSESDVLTLQDLIEDRRQQRRTMSVRVQGDPSEDPPENRALAVRVADLLTDGEGEIVEPEDTVDPDELPSQSVLLLTKDDSESWAQYIERTGITQLLHLARVKEVHIVVHAEETPACVEDLLDARVYSSKEVCTIEVNPYDATAGVYERQLEGLTSNV